MKKEKIEILQKAKEITTNEVQLLQWPYFCVSTAQPNDTQVEYTEILKLHGNEIRRRWVVRCHDDFGWPGQLEADVWRAVEHIMHIQRENGTLSNPVVTTLSEIRRYMPGKWRGGNNLQLTIKAIKCLTHTMVECDFFYDAHEKISRNASFSLIHEWRFDKRIISSGKEVLGKTKLLIHPDVFNNIAAVHVRPLDRGFRDGIRSWLAKRLYEVLGVKFYALRKKKVPYRTRYSRLCALMGCKRQKYLSQAKQIFGRAHKELQKSHFIGKIEWYSCTTDKNDWVVHYWPGERAVNECKNEYFNMEEIANPLFVEKIPKTGSNPVWLEQTNSDESAATVKIVSRFIEDSSNEGSDRNRADKEALSLNGDLSETDVSSQCSDEHKLTVDEVIVAFEKTTGSTRRISGLSEAENELYQRWNDLGVTIDVVVEGIKRVMTLENELSRKSGRKNRSIWSLDYCAWAIWDVFNKKNQASLTKDEHVSFCDPQTNKKYPSKDDYSYNHAIEWENICVYLKKWLAPKNYAQVIKEIISSRVEDKTLYLVVSDLYWKDRIFDVYETHLIEAFGTEVLEIEVDRGSA